MLNQGVFYSLRFIAIFYLILMVMMFFMGGMGGAWILGFLGMLVIGGFTYLFYRASEEAKRGTQLGQVLTGICALLFFISFLMGNGQGMKWLGLVLSGYWTYRVIYWEYD